MLFRHEALHVCRSMPDENENSNTSPAALSQIVSMPSFTHGPEFGAVVSLVVATVLVVVSVVAVVKMSRGRAGMAVTGVVA